MKLRPMVALPLAKAACGRPLDEGERKVLAALSHWVANGCPERRQRTDDEEWGNDDTCPDLEEYRR